MGRPIKRKYFGVGNVNDGEVFDGAGGEGLASVTITNPGTAYSQGISFTVAPSPIGGITAVVGDTEFANGVIATTSVITSGSGYVTAPAISIVKPSNVVVTATSVYPANGNVTVSTTSGLYLGMVANVGFSASATITSINVYGTNVVTMSSANTAPLAGTTIAFGDVGYGGALTAVLYTPDVTANVIAANAWISSGTIAKLADINAQKGARRYNVTNADGTDNCVLTGNALVVTNGGPLGAGWMTITATDSDGNTYYVKHLCDRTATLHPINGVQFVIDQKVAWVVSPNSPVNGVSVQIATNN